MDKNPVVHFEMPYEDRDRMVEFYTNAFGWESNKLGAEFGDYVVTMTSDDDPMTKRPTVPGTINGGFFKKTKEHQGITVVVAVKDIRDAMKKVEEAGGNIIGGGFKQGEPDDIPGVGLYIAFTDSEGNRVAMLEPKSI